MERTSGGGRLDLLLDKSADLGHEVTGFLTVKGGRRGGVIVAPFDSEGRQLVIVAS